MNKKMFKAIDGKNKGSILAYSLIILSMMMVIVISISTSSIIEKKAASGTEFSMQSLQTADSVTQLALNRIRAGGTLNDAFPGCSGGKVSGPGPVGSTYELTFLKADNATQVLCSENVSEIASMKSIGTYKGTARAVSVSVSGNACSASTACPGSCTFGGLTYGIVKGVDNRCWMDRNLGAKSYPYVITSKTDPNGYGWLFQWGRKSDAHQYTAWGGQSSPSLSSTTSTLSLSSTVSPPDTSKFIINAATLGMDWRNPGIAANPTNLWDGTMDNNPCPPGFHVPSITEWNVFKTNSSLLVCSFNCDNVAFSSWLQLTLAGIRDNMGGLTGQDGNGFYWSGTPHALGISAQSIIFTASFFVSSSNARAQGMSVRCIKDQF